MKIYFGGSIRGGRSDVDRYAELIAMLEDHGEVLTEHVGTENVEAKEAEQGLTDADIHQQDLAWLREADVVVAEVTTPSLGVGYEIGRAVEMETPILGLYRPDEDHDLSAMIRGTGAVRVEEYREPGDLEPVLAEFVDGHR